MRIEGSYAFKSDRQTVWDTLMAPDVLAGCIPGCQELEPVGEDDYRALIKVGIASMTGTFAGRVSLADKKPLESYRMLFEGSGTPGSIKGEAVVSFTTSEGGTEVTVIGDAQVTGVIARVGQRLLGSTSRMMMNQFFNCLKSRVEGP